MSDIQSVPKVLKFELGNKIKILKDIRREIKKKRFVLEESRERFGFDDMTQLTKVKNTSEVKGYPFVASKIESKILKGLKIGLKVVPVENKFEKHEHPTHLEFLALKELTDNIVCKNISPHIVFYLGLQKVSNKSRALKFLNLKRLEVEEQIRSNSNMLISEYIEGGSLDSWIYDIYENDKQIEDKDWRIIVFQLIYTIAIFQYYYRMMHNDFHYGNILMDTSIKKIAGQ
jgi:serine/threonine protein kinase